MSADALFKLCNSVALAGWIVLALFPRKRWSAPLLTGIVLPLLLGIVYAALVIGHFGEAGGGFDTLEHVATLFNNRWALLAGWVHYLAFDLFVGSWVVRDSQRSGVPHWAVLPALLLVFLLGPLGLLVYLAVRGAKARRLSAYDA